MNTFTFTLRVMRRYKGWFGLAGLLLLGVTAVMAALPLAADGLIAQSYAQSLTQANVAGRNLQVFTSSSAIDVERYQLVPELVQESVEVREILAPIDDANGLSGLKLWSFTGLEPAVTLIDGRLPTTTDGNIEAAIGQEAAARTGLSAGNTISSGRHEITITGIIAPQDMRDDIWFDDLSPFDLIVTPQEEDHLVTLSLLIQPETMRSAFPA
ncbi:MAG: hypothetical protein GY943_34185, partial [Chloroflexi bacterium]|nr:hypothetical protein [Chloroflexota bacterium]